MNTYVIDLNNLPNQKTLLNMDLFGQKRTLRIDLGYKEICGYWTMTITDWDSKEVLLSNAPLVTGGSLDSTGDILKQFGYFRIGQCGISAKSNNTTDYPNGSNIESEFLMFWRDE